MGEVGTERTATVLKLMLRVEYVIIAGYFYQTLVGDARTYK